MNFADERAVDEYFREFVRGSLSEDRTMRKIDAVRDEFQPLGGTSGLLTAICTKHPQPLRRNSRANELR